MAKMFVALGIDRFDDYWDASYPCKTKSEAVKELNQQNNGVINASLRFIEVDLPTVKEKVDIDKVPTLKICTTKEKK